MKKTVKIIIMALLLIFVSTAEAQILKRITKKIQDKVLPKTVNSDTLSEQENESRMNVDIMGMVYGKNKVDVATIPLSYPFSWEYTLEIKSDNDKLIIADYLLEPDAEYFGFKIRNTEDMFIIIDSKNGIMINAFYQEKVKMAMVSKIPDYSKMEDTRKEIDDYTYTTLPNKVIMGYNCKGIQAKNKEFEMVFYFTNEAKISFADLFKTQQNKTTPNALKNYFKPDEKPLMMTMTMKDLANKGAITSMKCINIAKKTNAFKKSDYTFM
ncbi:hypothetical protein RCH18_001526 [Flavobacterium sp. PL11]|uniref:hypothetical protein n=1 Tax=Flavobacterium sp. PL11 TaxID=3071717 RepID=UPI002DFE23B1|nr:hypothetical protein [Flavobacterium sp. PL11]